MTGKSVLPLTCCPTFVTYLVEKGINVPKLLKWSCGVGRDEAYALFKGALEQLGSEVLFGLHAACYKRDRA